MKKLFCMIAISPIAVLLANAQDVEVKYFHGKQRCATCLSIERCAQELINEKYADAQKKGKIKFSVIDISTEEGRKMAQDYKVSWSSLFVVTTKDSIKKTEERQNVTNLGFQYAKEQPEEFKDQLEVVINKALK